MANTNFIKDLISAGVTDALTQLGLASGEISQAKATKVYGSWFTDAVKESKLKPVRQGTGKTATKFFKVTDILALRASEELAASLIN